MSSIKDFADDLHAEVVSEMAEKYFGQRKDLDDMLDGLDVWAADLRKQHASLLFAASRLHHLLLDRETVRRFYISLDVLPTCVPLDEKMPACPIVDKPPFAFTRKGRYVKSVMQAYELFQHQVDEYLNGKYFMDEQGRKRLTVHLVRFRSMVEYVNSLVGKLNCEMSPSAALRYLRSMDPVTEERSTLIDPCLTEGCALDRDLCFKPVTLSQYELLQLQDLPSLGKVEREIREFSEALYNARKDEVLAAMSCRD